MKKIWNWLDEDINVAYVCFGILFIGSILNKPPTDFEVFVGFTGIWFLIQHYNRPKEEKKDGNSNQG